MAGRHLAVDHRRDGGQLHHRLRDPAARVLDDAGAQRVQLLGGRPRTDHDALAAGAVHRLEHELGEPVEHLLAVRRLLEPPGVDAGQQRFLGEVVADQVGNVGVDQLVVGDAVADRVGQRDVAGAGSGDQPCAAEHRVRTELGRVEELVVDPPVDHVHGLEALGGADRDASVVAQQVAALDELDAHHPGQQRVLEVGGVVHAGGQHDDRRVADAAGRSGPQRGQQVQRVALHRTDPVPAGDLGQRGEHGAPVRHHVGHPGRHPDVVLEHPEAAHLVADQVDAGDVAAHAVRWTHPGHHPVVVRRGDDDLARDDAVAEHPALAVDVGEEGLEGAHPLGDAGLDLCPLVRQQHAGHDVEREGPLLAADVEGDTLVEVGRLQVLGPCTDLVAVELGELPQDRPVRDPDALGTHDLVEGLRGAGIVTKQDAHLAQVR